MTHQEDNYHLIETRKYKDINLYLRFSMPFSQKRRTALIILGNIIGEASVLYDTKEKMTRAKDMLFNLEVNNGTKYRNNVIIFSSNISFLNPKFSKLDDSEYLNYIKEIIFNPLFEEKLFLEKKRNQISTIKRKIDKPNVFASSRVNEIIKEDINSFTAYDLNIVDELEKLTLNDVKKVYQELLTKSNLQVYIAGDVKKEFVEKLKKLPLRSNLDIQIKTKNSKLKEKKDITDKKSIKQSYLSVVYNTPYNYMHKDFYAWVLGNVFLGIVPTSLLFEEVREKLSLCYTISVIDCKPEGLVRIYTDIDGDKKKVVVKEIERQIKRLIDMDYDTNKLEMSKLLFINSLKSSYDDIQVLVDFYHTNALYGSKRTLEEYITGIMQVTPLEISMVFKNYQHYFTYMLKGTLNEKDC